MNTFGASAYLKAERDAVKDTLLALRERLKKLKIEELSIRSEIRLSMGATGGGIQEVPDHKATRDAASAANSFEGGGPTVATGTRVWVQSLDAQRRQQQLHEQDEMSVNQAPLELDINEALKIISSYKSGGGVAEAYEDHDPFFDTGGDGAGEDVEEEEEEEEENEDDDDGDPESEVYERVEVDEGHRSRPGEAGQDHHFFDDFELGRELDEDGEHFDDRPSTSSMKLSSDELQGERPPKMFKLHDDSM